MGFLAGLYKVTVPELPVAAVVVDGVDATVEPGYLHRISGSDSDVTLTIAPLSLDAAANKRFAVKVYLTTATAAGTLTILAPAGQTIEADSGELGDGVELDQALGTYREWVCDAEGHWLLVGGGW